MGSGYDCLREYDTQGEFMLGSKVPGTENAVIARLAPYAWLDAEAVNTTTLTDAFRDLALPGRLFSFTGTTKSNTPSPSSLFKNRLVVPFVQASATQYRANDAAANWTFGNDGSGAEFWCVYASNAAATGQILLQTLTATTGFDLYTATGAGATAAQAHVFNGGAAAFTAVGVSKVTPTCLRLRMGAAASPQYSLFQDGVLTASGSYAPAAGSAQLPLTVGGQAGFFFDGLLAAVVSFNRLLSAPDAAQMSAAVTSKWGVPA